MTLSEYQQQAQRTAGERAGHDKIDNGVLGLCGEAGEVADLWKKHRHQGHPLDRLRMVDELGDVLWYIAELASGLNVTLEDIARNNVLKLQARYPDGFEAARSIHRGALEGHND